MGVLVEGMVLDWGRVVVFVSCVRPSVVEQWTGRAPAGRTQKGQRTLGRLMVFGERKLNPEKVGS